MSNLENRKLTNEELEQVTGGYSYETSAIREALYDSGTVPRKTSISDDKLKRILSSNGITAKLSRIHPNQYIYDGEEISQRKLIRMINNGEINY